VIVMMTLDQLRKDGPQDLRIWLALNRPRRVLPRLREAQLVSFDRGTPHQDTSSSTGEG
jgi:hypothetical protein